jgi:hypothetical protein
MTGLEIIAIAGLTLAAAGTAVSIAGAQAQADAAADAAKTNARIAARDAEANARLADREAQVARNAAVQEDLLLDFDVESSNRGMERLLSTQRALIGASGVEFGGSPLLVAIDTAREAELQIEAQRFDSRLRQQELRDQAALSTFQAAELRATGRHALSVGRFQAGAARSAGRWRSLELGLEGAAAATSVVLKSPTAFGFKSTSSTKGATV